MTRSRIIHHPEAEKAIVGEMAVIPDVIRDVSAELDMSVFYDQSYAAAFDLLVRYWKDGDALTPEALMGKLRDEGRNVDPAWMLDVVEGIGAWRVHAEIVKRDHALRQLQLLNDEAVKAVVQPGADPDEIRDRLVARAANIEGPLPRGFEAHSVEWYLDQDAEQARRWLVPGLLRARWRVIVVAGEGGGKSTLLRQFAMLAGQGVHPLHFKPIPHVRTLYVDMENDAFGPGHTQLNRMRDRLSQRLLEDYVPEQVEFVFKPQGVNLQARADRRSLEANVREYRPDVLILGPVYRMVRRAARQSDEDMATALQEVLDDLRIRYDLAVILEHHAPKGASSDTREMLPFGPSVWMRWPDIGLGLERVNRADPSRLAVKHWREPRDTHQWPPLVEWDRSQVWPWMGAGSDGWMKMPE